MKKTITIIAVLIYGFCKGQVSDSVPIKFTSGSFSMQDYSSIGWTNYHAYAISICNNGECSKIEIDPQNHDSVISITGDTIALLKMLLKLYNEKDSASKQDYKTIAVGVEYLNQLPEKYKSFNGNCKWTEYMDRLRISGYHSTGQPYKPCNQK